MEIFKLTDLFATTSPLLFLNMDWKLIFCGACEKPNRGKRMNNMILGYMILDFKFYREHLQDKTLKSIKLNNILSVAKCFTTLYFCHLGRDKKNESSQI